MLIHGELLENKDTISAIGTVQRSIIKTLSKEPLDISVVLDAADRLAREVLCGALEEELAFFLGQDSFTKKEITSLASLFQKEVLQEKLRLELFELKDHKLCKHKGFQRMPLGSLLHIAAGNVDALPAYSVLEGLLAGNINLLKLPSMDQGFSLFLLKKMIAYQPLLKEYIFVFDTPSTDLQTIERLMKLVNGIVVWGSDEAVSSVRKHAPVEAKLIEWGHKLSFAYIEDLNIPDTKLVALARHLFQTKQLLCSSCQVIYLDTDDFEVVKRFGKRFRYIMRKIEEEYENPLPVQGKIAIELLTRNLEQKDGFYANRQSSVTCLPDSKLELSFLFGNVFVKPLPKEKIVTALYHQKQHLQTVSIYPNKDTLRRCFLRVGVTNICEISEMSSFSFLGSHDGSFALQQYTRIVEYTR